MDDKRIVELYLERSESAIAETTLKYGKYLRYIAYSILENEQDSEEIENDTYRKLWESIPPNKPDPLGAYIAKICRNLSINRYEERNAQKRKGAVALVLDELAEVLPDTAGGEEMGDELALREALNGFLRALDPRTRTIFLQRYWYTCPVADIARSFSMKESTVTMLLFRTRKKLREHLHKEGIDL